jgi:ribosomal protein S27E
MEEVMLCEYGCNQEAKHYFKVVKKWCCSKSTAQCPALREVYRENCKKAHLAGAGLGWPKSSRLIKGETAASKPGRIWSFYAEPDAPKLFLRIYRENEKPNTVLIKRILFHHKLREIKCEICENVEWLSMKIWLQLHHKNKNRQDNRNENLQLLCPNCHSTTTSFCGKGNKRER